MTFTKQNKLSYGALKLQELFPYLMGCGLLFIKIGNYSKGEFINNPGYVNIIYSGIIEVIFYKNQSDKIIITNLKKGDIFGINYLYYLEDPMLYTVKNNSQIISVPSVVFSRLLRNKKFSNYLIKCQEEYKINLASKMACLLHKKCATTSISLEIINLIKISNDLHINLTHFQLGERINITRETVSRVLKKFEKMKIIAKVKGKKGFRVNRELLNNFIKTLI